MTDVTSVIRELKEKSAQIAVAIEALESLNGAQPRFTGTIGRVKAYDVAPKRKKRFSKATRAKMRAAQQARWKKIHAGKAKRNG